MTTTTSTMPPPKPISLTLILAATPSLGIGANGGLPWPMLRKEMAYFARVTKRIPAATLQADEALPESQRRKRMNAVVMGRKTWDSIPEKLRPLKGRVNVVVSRSPENVQLGGGDAGVEGPVVVGSIHEAIEKLEGFSKSMTSSSSTTTPSSSTSHKIERVFIMGGATIYKAALELPQTKRILLTKIKKEFECDTFFPVDLDKRNEEWRQVERKGLEEFVGEEVSEVGEEEKGVGFEFCLYEKVEGA